MKIEELDPRPTQKEVFRLNRYQYIPEQSACYALVSFQEDVLYVGIAENLRRRFENHLNDPRMISITKYGTAFFIYWLTCNENELEKIERTWQNQCELQDGSLPVLNRIRSPVSV